MARKKAAAKKTAVRKTTKKTAAKRAAAQPMNVHVVIDRSGSMQSIRDDAIGGFNAFLKETKGPGQKWWVWLFDTQGIDLIQDGVASSKVEKLSTDNFVPRAATPLYDAVGAAIAKAKNVRKTKLNILMVLTDGQENSSKEWSAKEVKKELTRLADEENWQVIFVAVGAEAWDETTRFNMGVVVRNTRSKKSMQHAYGTVAEASMDYAAIGSPRKMSWDIDDDGVASG
jgi:Mg-chelatase subunit ChlD